MLPNYNKIIIKIGLKNKKNVKILNGTGFYLSLFSNAGELAIVFIVELLN